ncbi:tetratricopeptide repeat protein [Cyanobacterium sp. uoEpiScrs1]|uniref:tetratricopeptide repeat protein n=1 Tax=Cyanobacterium sp. uoEpiScrs1 TaxID=2976343 RepID=UPI002269E284|nr:tetratricopeptide repeat protein [Cyanobacterium sp. uoEpiScrs1]
MTKLSLCMIVKDEEKNLTTCLESVQNIVDEMVVMDTGSTDKTVEIAQKFGAIVPCFSWCNDFSIARNAALNYTTGDWVLILDADEVFNQKIAYQIREAIADENNLVINLVRHEIGASQSPYSLVSRLFRRHPAVKFSRPYHAIIDDSVSELLKRESNWKIAELPMIAVFHYGYNPKAITSLDKYKKARQAMENFIKDHPNDPYVCSKLGALYLQINKEKSGIKLLKQALKSNKANTHILFELHYHLGNAYTRQQDNYKAIKHYQKALDQEIMPPLKLGAYNNLGVALQSMGNFKSASKAYETTIQIDPSFVTGYYNFAITLNAMGKLTDAETIYKKLLSLSPNYAAAYQNLGVVLFKLKKVLESVENFRKAINLYEEQNSYKEAEELRSKLKKLGIWKE